MRATRLPEIPDSAELDPHEQQVASREFKDQCGEQLQSRELRAEQSFSWKISFPDQCFSPGKEQHLADFATVLLWGEREIAGLFCLLGNTGWGTLLPCMENVSMVNSIVVSREALRSLLVKCGRRKDLAGGRKVHCLMISNGVGSDSFLSDHLIRCFAACGSLLEACVVFNSVGNPTVYTWQAMISAYMSSGENQKAICAFDEMQRHGIKPDKVTYLYALRICGMLGSLRQGRHVHEQVSEDSGLISDLAIGSTLVDMYAKCGDHGEACAVFGRLPSRDVVCWNALLGSYLHRGDGDSALRTFQRMKQDCIEPDRVTFLHLLKAYTITGAIDDGYRANDNIVIIGLDSDVSIVTTLIDMYVKFESLEEARKIFDGSSARNVVSWNAMIAGYAQQGDGHLAYQMFDKMREDGVTPDVTSWNVLISGSTQREDGVSALEALDRMQQQGIQPNQVSFLCALRACVRAGAVVSGKHTHDQIVRCGLESDAAVGNTIVDMYAKFGYLEEARSAFNCLSHRDIVSWNALLVGYTQHEQDYAALEVFSRMQQQPDQFTLSSVLKACGNIGTLEQGKIIHGTVLESCVEPDMVTAGSLVDMYARCGSMEDAESMFRSLKGRDVASWNSMIAGYAQHGLCEVTVRCLADMEKKDGLMPSDTTYVSVLAACSHAGDVLKGWEVFQHMKDEHTIVPRIEHFNSMIDLLGHSGNLYEAKELIDTMPHSPSMTSWLSLLHSCGLYNHKLLGRECFSRAFHLDQNLAAGYVMMANLHVDYEPLCSETRTETLHEPQLVWNDEAYELLMELNLEQEFHALDVECRLSCGHSKSSMHRM